MTKLTIQNTMGDMDYIPELGEFSKYLMYAPGSNGTPEQFAKMPIDAFRNIGWSPEAMVRGVNTLIEQVVNGAKYYHVYTETECIDDPQKKDVNIMRLTPECIDPKKPYIVLVAGGAYMTVCSATESYTTAVHMLEMGYQVFVFTYRVATAQATIKAVDDLAKALAFIDDRADEFELTKGLYAIAGFSAGANLISTWGTANAGWKSYNMAKPKAMFPVYTFIDVKTEAQKGAEGGIIVPMFGEDYTEEIIEKYHIAAHIDADYPPCYIVCGKNDTTVPCRNSEWMKELLDEAGVSSILDEGDNAPHGFGDGTGTDVEGWPERAIAFLESL